MMKVRVVNYNGYSKGYKQFCIEGYEAVWEKGAGLFVQRVSGKINYFVREYVKESSQDFQDYLERYIYRDLTALQIEDALTAKDGEMVFYLGEWEEYPHDYFDKKLGV